MLVWILDRVLSLLFLCFHCFVWLHFSRQLSNRSACGDILVSDVPSHVLCTMSLVVHKCQTQKAKEEFGPLGEPFDHKCVENGGNL